jgi:anti-sigma B factor antagonist
MSVTVTVRDAPGVAIVDLSGRITLAEGSELLRSTIKKLVDGGRKNVLLNLADVSYIDSSGLAELASAYVTVSNLGGQLKLLNPRERLKDLLQITRLYTLFVTYTDEAEALRSFGAEQPA